MMLRGTVVLRDSFFVVALLRFVISTISVTSFLVIFMVQVVYNSYLTRYLKVYKYRHYKVTIEVTNMTTQLTTTRAERGQAIAQHNGQVQRIEEEFYTVQSQSGNGEYAVTKIGGEWTCECPDNKYRHVECKHIHAVIISKALRTKVETRMIAPVGNLST
jgi:hypothetical protein